MHELFRGLRQAGRRASNHPATSAIAILTMALGIALVTGTFAILDGIMIRGLPFDRSEQLLHLERSHLERGISSMAVSPHDFEDWRLQQESFEDLAAFVTGTVFLAGDHLPERYAAAWMSASSLDLLRVEPTLGRGFTAEDERQDAAPVILISHRVWQNRYGGRSDVLGSVVRTNGSQATLVGVLPPGFRFPVRQDVWLPLQLETHLLDRGEGTALEVFGRLRHGVSRQQAASQMALLAERLGQQYPETNGGVGSIVQPFVNEFVPPDTRDLLTLTVAAVVLILLIACFNVANLLIGRTLVRRQELAIRSVLGSSRWRTVGQVLADAGLLVVLGGGLGIGLAHFVLVLVNQQLARFELPFWYDFQIDGRVLLFACMAVAISVILAGSIPALQATRANLSRFLPAAGRSSTDFRMSCSARVLLVCEVAFSCALLLGAALTVRSVLEASRFELGFESSGLLTARAGLGIAQDEGSEETGPGAGLYERLKQRIAAHPEVAAVAISDVIPTDTKRFTSRARYEQVGESYATPRDMPRTRLSVVSPEFFEVFEVDLLAGRAFTPADREGAVSVAIVNEAFARREWPGQNPIGRTVDLWMGKEREGAAPDAGRLEVVGMVPTLRFAEFDNNDDQQALYMPLAQQPLSSAWIAVKTHSGDPLSFSATLRELASAEDPDLALYWIRSMDQVFEDTLSYSNLVSALYSVLGGIALILACVGLYGVMSFGVSRRTQEMGVRLAIGATARDLTNLVLRDGLRKVAFGLMLGLALGYVLSLGLRNFLFGIGAQDPLTFTVVPVILMAVAAAACLIPARRAAGVDPITALRDG